MSVGQAIAQPMLALDALRGLGAAGAVGPSQKPSALANTPSAANDLTLRLAAAAFSGVSRGECSRPPHSSSCPSLEGSNSSKGMRSVLLLPPPSLEGGDEHSSHNSMPHHGQYILTHYIHTHYIHTHYIHILHPHMMHHLAFLFSPHSHSGMSIGGGSLLPFSGNPHDSYAEDRNTQTGFIGSDPNSSQHLQYQQQQRLQQLVQHAQQLLQHQQQEHLQHPAKRHHHQQAGQGAVHSQYKRKSRNEEARILIFFLYCSLFCVKY